MFYLHLKSPNMSYWKEAELVGVMCIMEALTNNPTKYRR